MNTLHTPESYGSRRTDPLLTQNDIAELLRVSRWTVARLIKRGDLRGVRVGDRLRFTQDEIRAFLERETSP
jgi:excisionase family DNA binding protein